MTDITVDEYENCLKGFNIVDCSVRDRNTFYFIAREDYTTWPKDKWNPDEEAFPGEGHILKNIIAYYRDEPTSEKWSRNQLQGHDLFISGVAHKPKPQLVAVSHSLAVRVIGSGESLKETIPDRDDGGPLRGGIRKLRTIDGWVYLCGGNNSLARREGPSVWKNYTVDIPNPERDDDFHNTFEDVDGFDENDIYCVGREGQVFHYDGISWQQRDFPSNQDMRTVCCADDGFVYISGFKGATYKGRDDEWARISGPEIQLPFKDMVWHDDKLWCTNDNGVWVVSDGKLARAELPDGIGAYAGNLSTGDGVLLLSGYGGAAFLENKKWTVIYSTSLLSRALKNSDPT